MFRENVIIAALLHDTLEDTTLTLDEIEIEFSPRIAQMVDRLTRKIDPATGKKMSAGECLLKALKLGDDEAVLVKMVDRWHNTSTIMTLSKEKQERIIKETIKDFFVLAMQNKNSNIELLLEKVLLSHKRKTTSQNYLLQASENDEVPNNILLTLEQQQLKPIQLSNFLFFITKTHLCEFKTYFQPMRIILVLKNLKRKSLHYLL